MFSFMGHEYWKDIPINTNYQISTNGRIWSKIMGSILIPRVRNGYQCINLWDNGNPKRYTVHYLVLLTFISNRPSPPNNIIRHYPDQNPLNNRLENIEYSSQTQNTYDQIENDTYTCAKLTPEDVIEIKEALLCGISGSILSKTYNISAAVITNIKHNKIWKNIGPDTSMVFQKYGKRSKEEVEKIELMLQQGYTQTDIAKIMKCDQATVSNIKNKKHYK
jgi:hypothetical protein